MIFINDIRGRVPFAVLGIFLIIGSAVTSGIVANLEKEHAKEIPVVLKSESVNYMVKYAEADISRILAYSCLQAMKKIGESPVIYSNLSVKAARDYADENGDGRPDEEIVGDNGVVDTFSESVKFNKNWARNMARVNFNRYINATFIHNIYRNGDYAINIFDPENNGAINDWRDIEISDINMELERSVYIKSLISEESNIYPAYWKASVKNLKIEISNISSGKNFIQSIDVECLVPSRLPLLMELTEIYHNSINGVSSLMGLVTGMGEGCTEIRSLLQYAGKYNWVSNIVDNRWLQYLTNAGLITIQYLVFNSVDPLELAYLAININDLISKSNIREDDEYIQEKTEDAIKNFILSATSLPIDFKENIFKTFGNGTDEKAKEEFENLMGREFMERGNVTVWGISRNILNESETTYYYFNESAHPKLILEHEWKGYGFTRNGYFYHLSSEDGDVYKNITAFRKIFTRKYLPHLNSTVMDIIYKEIWNTYGASFSTVINKTKIEESYSCQFLGEWTGPINCGKWNLVCSTPESSVLLYGEIPHSPPRYSETWILEWERNETWKHKECHTENILNDTVEVCEWVPYNITHHYKEKAIFSLVISNYSEDIQDIFHGKTIFGNKYDDNLEFLLQKYVNNYFIRWRDYYTDVNKDEGIRENLTLSCKNWKNDTADGETTGYEKINWLADECVSALYNITNMIRKDGNKYGKISRNFNSTVMDLSVIDKEKDLIVKEFENNTERYLGRQHYMEGDKYKSAAARVIMNVRKWFIDEIEKKLNVSYTSMVEREINEQLERRDTGNFETYDNYRTTLEEYKNNIANIPPIQFGNTMRLRKDWDENISLAISAKPCYFDFKNPPSGEEDWQFDIKNICLFGPTGLPILPTPVTPWVVTLNSWYIHADGHWDTFEVIDSSDETHPDPLFGHVGQVYLRERKPVFDSICHPESNPEIGQCKRLNFEFDTMNLGIVPSGRLPIGDLGSIVESNSVGK